MNKGHFLGKMGEFFLYSVNRNGRWIISIQNRDGVELCTAENEKAAKEWCEAYS